MELVPFNVGECYENRARKYRVLEILDDGLMRVEYLDTGEIDELGTAMQRRILRNMNIDAKVAKLETARKRSTGPSDRRGNQFRGLIETDFRLDISGSTWRRKGTLAGLLAHELADVTEKDFQHKTVYRQPAVYVFLNDRYDQRQKLRVCNMLFQLGPDGAEYGLQISRSNRAMDASWDWPRLMTALEDETLQEGLLMAMRQYNLTWHVRLREGDDKQWEEATITPKITSLLWHDEQGEFEIDWAEFRSRLLGLDDSLWCDLYLFGHLDKDSAMALGTGIAIAVRDVFEALVPLYIASTIERD